MARKSPRKTVSPPARQIFSYCRVSTLSQAEGMSLEAQQRTVIGYAMMADLEITRTFVESGVSGSRPLSDRPEGAVLLAALRPGDVVIASKLDRLFRSALDALETARDLQARGIELHLCDLGGNVSNGMSKMFFTITSAFAEAERDRIRERITEAKRDQREQGRFLGGHVPWAHLRDGDLLLADPAKAKMLTYAKKRRADGASLRKIQAELLAKYGERVSHISIDRAAKRAPS